MRKKYDWALSIDYEVTEARARLWYISEEKLEPRLGSRIEESLDLFEQPLAPGYDASRLYKDLTDFDLRKGDPDIWKMNSGKDETYLNEINVRM